MLNGEVIPKMESCIPLAWLDMTKAIVSISATLVVGKIISTAYVITGVSVIGVAIGLFVFGFVIAGVLYYLDDKYQLSSKLIEVLRDEGAKKRKQNTCNFME
ncbi:hypothetical protein [Xenorhabdus griffiniae]|uniref:hypothetical protein n=1 Tax=Xenorhabdus griffiniae TaxID=351672 RepID=UPI0023594C62|nr:hypothetical protein [Xenorhabdus griffiniae]MDC9604707.1 hypothetical protein [Xenorhabdus griffiniae]